MGIPLGIFSELAGLSARFRPGGRSMMLGRQRLKLGDRRRLLSRRLVAEETLRRHRPDLALADCVQPDGYAEAMFRTLGFGDIATLDYSAFEGAELLWDLNRPVPQDWHGRFDFIFDGGTLEHVFDVPQALRSIFAMLRPGGRFVTAGPLNGWVGHGLYQFGPELVWSFWGRTCGCTVHSCRAVDRRAVFRLELPDPGIDGQRREYPVRWHGRSGLPPRKLYLWAEVEKTEGASLGETPLQSDYVVRWSEPADAAAGDNPEVRT